ncbi:MAG TPA: FixH family protein [Kofleriaceae bacterium]|jgi:hypothetical protein|nr:FixH family protein [Kofleriaceae bacterium]
MRFPHAAVLLSCALLGSAPGCSDDPSDEDVDCQKDTRADDIVDGMEKMGERQVVSFRLVSASPSPPRRPDNTWIMALQSAGAPLVGATVSTTLFMPDHNHGTQIKPVITATSEPGTYKFEPLNLWMPGLWEITFEATPAGGSKDRAVFRVCVPD